MKMMISRISVLFAVLGVVLAGCGDASNEQDEAFHYGPGPGGEAPGQLERVE